MAPRPLIEFREQRFSQNGEEGVIACVFDVIGQQSRFCCEFGAWDGSYLSNCYSLILEGWSALLIEGNREKADLLRERFAENDRITCVNAFVDARENSLANILERHGSGDRRLDVLSIDIDGLDYDIFDTLDRLRALPRLVVVEVQPEHGPDRTERIPSRLARRNVGQPLQVFADRGRELGYRLICYVKHNAFFLANDAGGHDALPTLSVQEAWAQAFDLIVQSRADAEYLFMRNCGMLGPYRFNNPLLSAERLGISAERVSELTRNRKNERRGRHFRRLQRWFSRLSSS